MAHGAEAATNTANRTRASLTRQPENLCSPRRSADPAGEIEHGWQHSGRMQRLYRGARSGNLPVWDLTRLIFALRKPGTVGPQVIDQVIGQPATMSPRSASSAFRGWSVIGLLSGEAHARRDRTGCASCCRATLSRHFLQPTSIRRCCRWPTGRPSCASSIPPTPPIQSCRPRPSARRDRGLYRTPSLHSVLTGRARAGNCRSRS